MPDSSAPPLDQDSSRSAMSLCTTCAQINPLEICSSRNRDRLKGAGYTARARLRTQRARERDAPACIRPDEQPEDLGGGLLPPSLDILYITMLRALLASLWLTALYARALTGAERRAPLRAKRTKRPPSSSAGAKTRTRYVDDPGFVGDGYFEAVEVHRREPPRAARTPSLDFGNATRPVYVADPLWL